MPRRKPPVMRRQDYQAAIAQLKQDHPWLERQLLEVAPGHLPVLRNLVEQLERLMHPCDYRRRPLLCVTTIQEKFTVRAEFPGASIERQRALLDVLHSSRYAAQNLCPLCGTTVAGGDLHEQRGVRCEAHSPVVGLFAEDIARWKRVMRALTAEKPMASQPSPAEVPEEQDPPEELPSPTKPIKSEAPPDEPAKRSLQVAFLDPLGLKRFVDRHRAKNDDKFRRAQAVAERIWAAGEARRQLGTLPSDWAAILDEFAAAFPNFGELAELLRDHFALNALGDARIHWPPVLLVGPAGIGKTEAARWLASRLELPAHVFDMASAQSGSPLAGSEAFWSNSEPGQLFELLAYQPKANAVAVLDELDKVQQSKGYDPVGALYTLLEPRSACTFTDLSIRDFAIDASHVNWIATANSADDIPAPILSRLSVLHIEPPSSRQVAAIAKSIYGRMRAEAAWGSAFEPKLDDAVLERLQDLPPRSLVLALRRAFGAAARAQRVRIAVEDLPTMQATARREIGFIPAMQRAVQPQG